MRCPVCRAENDRGPQCRRCRADLTLLFRLEGQRSGLVERARNELARGRPEEALALLDDAEALRRGDDLCPLRAAAHLLRRDFAEAWRSYQDACGLASGEEPCPKPS
jgi:hypothetical protein